VYQKVTPKLELARKMVEEASVAEKVGGMMVNDVIVVRGILGRRFFGMTDLEEDGAADVGVDARSGS